MMMPRRLQSQLSAALTETIENVSQDSCVLPHSWGVVSYVYAVMAEYKTQVGSNQI